MSQSIHQWGIQCFQLFFVSLIFSCNPVLQNNPSKTLPLWGPDDSFHFNPVLLEKIINSRYFQKCCREMTDWNKLVDEIYYSVQDLEPFAMGEYNTGWPIRTASDRK